MQYSSLLALGGTACLGFTEVTTTQFIFLGCRQLLAVGCGALAEWKKAQWPTSERRSRNINLGLLAFLSPLGYFVIQKVYSPDFNARKFYMLDVLGSLLMGVIGEVSWSLVWVMEEDWTQLPLKERNKYAALVSLTTSFTLFGLLPLIHIDVFCPLCALSVFLAAFASFALLPDLSTLLSFLLPTPSPLLIRGAWSIAYLLLWSGFSFLFGHDDQVKLEILLLVYGSAWIYLWGFSRIRQHFLSLFRRNA